MISVLLTALLGCSSPAAVPDVRLGNVRTVEITPMVAAGWARGIESPLTPTFGRDPNEPVGPWAVFADRGGASVLDQVQGRIVRYDLDGVPLGTVPIPSYATFDAVSTTEGYGLLSWTQGDDAHWSAASIDGTGAITGDTRLDLDPPTAVLYDAATEHLLVEDRHVETVDVLSGDRFPGRPSGTGWYVSAHKDDLLHVTLTWANADSSETHAVRLVVDRPVVNLVALEPAGDDVVVGLFLMENTADPTLLDPEVRVIRVDRVGHLEQEFRLPAGEGLDPNRSIALLPDGSVLQLRPTRTSVELGRVQP